MTDKPVLSFNALQLANEQRNSYGLRYNDHTRYRKHCANRTHRIRSTLKTTHGRGRDFKKLPAVTSDNIREGHLHLYLFEAERAWAHAQDLSATSAAKKTQGSSATHMLRHSATGRFRRALRWSERLRSHCQALHAVGRLSTANCLQATVYTLITHGRFSRHRDNFDDALAHLGVARILLTALAAAPAAMSRDQALAAVWIDELAPEIRHCAHELGHEEAYDIDAVVVELAAPHRDELVEGCDAMLEALSKEGGEQAAKKWLEPLEWEGQPVPIRSTELVDALLRVQDAQAMLASAKRETQGDKESVKNHGSSKRAVAAYDAILLALSDAEEVARKLSEAQQRGSIPGAAAGTRDLTFVHAYIMYQCLARRIQRDLLLMSALLASQSPTRLTRLAQGKKTQVDTRLFPAVVKLLDTVMQSLGQMRTLSIVDDSPNLASAIDARQSFTRGRRCLYLAWCYSLAKKYAEALTLMQRGYIYIRETRSAMSLSEQDPITHGSTPYYPLSPSQIDELESEISAAAFTFKKDWFAYNGGSVDAEPDSHKKPVFYDIALNYVRLDIDRLRELAGLAATQTAEPSSGPAEERKFGGKAKVEEEIRPGTPEPKTAAPSRGGLSSLLGGWWGRT